MAAAFRSIGIDAHATPDSDHDTLELGGLHSSGEECLPHKVTLGDFLKLCRAPGADPKKLAFFMPLAPGPCRFGQYAPYLKMVLAEQGFADAMVVSPSSSDGYNGFTDTANELITTAWLGIVLADLSTRLLLKTRPYETRAGDSDESFEYALQAFAEVLATRDITTRQRVARLVDTVRVVRDRFRSVPAKYVRGRPLVGIVGEIFCRLNTFSNEDAVRRIEQLGGECWISDVTEWVWYTNWCRGEDCVRDHGRLSVDMLKLKLKTHFQHKYEQMLLAPTIADFKGYEEPHDFSEVVAASEPYLPAGGSMGEMTVSVGKAVYLYRKGVDGIIDISPFTCMNGIITEAVYPRVSADHDDIPIRSLYFDKVGGHIDRDLEIFLDLARAYQGRKQHTRVYPDYFK